VKRYIPDDNIVWLLENIANSFKVDGGSGLPLGNLTSQLFVNVYMNEFDQFMKHKMKANQYIRYADDFVILSQDREWLEELLPKIDDFLSVKLKLNLHPNKVSIRTLASGIDFLGWVHFPSYRALKTTTKRRMFNNIIDKRGNIDTIQSYLGLLSHGNSRKLEKAIRDYQIASEEEEVGY